MLPLVKQIVDDLLTNQKHLAGLHLEQERLDRQKRDLSWPERSRRYEVQEQVAAGDKNLQSALAELTSLGLVLVDLAVGRIGFPTVVNSRRAFFSWQHGEGDITHWHLPEEEERHTIPASWAKWANLSLSAKKPE
jgi:hypothetical protein